METQKIKYVVQSLRGNSWCDIASSNGNEDEAINDFKVVKESIGQNGLNRLRLVRWVIVETDTSIA